jgi:hypothetical protein
MCFEESQEQSELCFNYFLLQISQIFPQLGAAVAQSVQCDYGLDERGSIPDRGRGFFF